MEVHACLRWCVREGIELTGECWEVYGHVREGAPFQVLVGWPLNRR